MSPADNADLLSGTNGTKPHSNPQLLQFPNQRLTTKKMTHVIEKEKTFDFQLPFPFKLQGWITCNNKWLVTSPRLEAMIPRL